LNGGLELRAGDALETEKHVVQRTIVMVFAQLSGDAGAAFVYGPACDGESGDAGARAVRGFDGEISVKYGCVHVFYIRSICLCCVRENITRRVTPHPWGVTLTQKQVCGHPIAEKGVRPKFEMMRAA
jgi:hypothetical protein